ncbi:MAG: YceI family protein [Pseudomonadota bacterium]
MFWRSFLVVLLLPVASFAADWQLDPGSRIDVDVSWRGAVVTVNFPTIQGEVTFDEQRPDLARATIEVAARDATTGFGPVDALVRSNGYLATASYPKITFDLESLTPTSNSTASVAGQITLRGMTHPQAFDARVIRYGPATDAPEVFQAGFDLTGEIDRTVFGSTAGLPDVPARLPIRVRLLMSSKSPT